MPHILSSTDSQIRPHWLDFHHSTSNNGRVIKDKRTLGGVCKKIHNSTLIGIYEIEFACTHHLFIFF